MFQTINIFTQILPLATTFLSLDFCSSNSSMFPHILFCCWRWLSLKKSRGHELNIAPFDTAESKCSVFKFKNRRGSHKTLKLDAKILHKTKLKNYFFIPRCHRHRGAWLLGQYILRSENGKQLSFSKNFFNKAIISMPWPQLSRNSTPADLYLLMLYIQLDLYSYINKYHREKL